MQMALEMGTINIYNKEVANFIENRTIDELKSLFINFLTKEVEAKANQDLSNIQFELLKLYSTNVKESELFEIKNYLAKYFAQKAINEADTIWEKKGLDNDEMDRWLNEE